MPFDLHKGGHEAIVAIIVDTAIISKTRITVRYIKSATQLSQPTPLHLGHIGYHPVSLEHVDRDRALGIVDIISLTFRLHDSGSAVSESSRLLWTRQPCFSLLDALGKGRKVFARLLSC